MNPPSNAKKRTAYHHGDLRATLIEQAVALIHRRGDMNFSLRDLAAEVGVSHVSVYRHFSDKAALSNAVAVRGFSILAQALKDAAQGWDSDPAQQLARQGVAYLSMAGRYPGHFAAMFAPIVSQKGQTKEMQDASEEAYTMMVPTVMRKMQVASVSTPAVQSEALRCWALVHGLACLQLSGNLSACLGRDLSNASESELLDLVGGLLK
jgi:AcrR family transcriptional regulator